MTNESRPKAAPEIEAGRPITSSLALTPDMRLLARRATYAVVVVAALPSGYTRTRVFLSLPAAERAKARAESRGLPAMLSLVRLVTVPHATPDDLALVIGDTA